MKKTANFKGLKTQKIQTPFCVSITTSENNFYL